MYADINRVTLVGRLTRDAELRHTSAGMAVVSFSIAVNGRRRGASGDWEDKPNFFDVTYFGDRAERASSKLHKGLRLAIDGRLEWHSWETGGQKRSKVEVVANDIQILDRGDSHSSSAAPARAFGGASDIPDTSDFQPVGASRVDEDDIPF